jgi:integrase
MSVVHPTTPTKPSKPSPDFPLFPHATGRWAKKIKGKMVYFGPWNDPESALRCYYRFLDGKPMRRPKKRRRDRPARPNPEFPLFPHATRRWAKKIRGKLHYFGPWDDPQAALDKYLTQKDDLYAGRTPGVITPGVTVQDLVNQFLTSKKHKLQTGELSYQSFAEYHAACARIVDAFGRGRAIADLRPVDFEQLKFRFPANWGPVRRGKVIQLIRSVFRYAAEQDLIDRPVKFGAEFKRPGKKVLRVHKAKLKERNGERMFAAGELRAMVQGVLVVGEVGPELVRANMPFRAMIVLAANTAFGNTDCARLPLSALDLKGGWVRLARSKTGIDRRCPLWPETIELLRQAIADRPKAKNEADANLVFLTQRGLPWVKVHYHEEEEAGHKKVRVVQDDAIAKELKKLAKQLGIDRSGVGFYAIRHGFQTIGDEAGDPVAVRFLMGHADDADDMSAHYRERISDERLRAVVDHVRDWLFGDKPAPASKLADGCDDQSQTEAAV